MLAFEEVRVILLLFFAQAYARGCELRFLSSLICSFESIRGSYTHTQRPSMQGLHSTSTSL